MHTHTSAVTSSLVSFDNSIRSITGETDAKVIQKIRDRAVTLYQDPQKAYQTAIKLYQTIDKADAAMAVAALANKVGEKIGFLSFLSKFTPKADITQTIEQIQGQQYFLHYIGYDSSYDKWVNQDKIR